MIQNSFILLEKIGQRTEQKIWQQGIDNWDNFITAQSVKGVSRLRKGYYDRQIEHAQKELYSLNSEYFTKILHSSHHWRLYDFFKDDAVYLDIETSGYYGDITVIGLYDGHETKTMVRGFSLDKDVLKKELSQYKLILTFNGSSFDLPIIEKYFQGVIPNIPHIDLRHVFSKIGFTGGLKAIESRMGIKRAKEVQNMSGEDAVYLWNMWKTTGDRKHLEKLVQYNEEDIINLKPLAEYGVKTLWSQLRAQSQGF